MNIKTIDDFGSGIDGGIAGNTKIGDDFGYVYEAACKL